jgi:hypothetical protein
LTDADEFDEPFDDVYTCHRYVPALLRSAKMYDSWLPDDTHFEASA